MTDEEKIALANKVLACQQDPTDKTRIHVPGHIRSFYAYDLLNKLLTKGPYE